MLPLKVPPKYRFNYNEKLFNNKNSFSVMKDTKNEAIPQVKKANASAIKKRIQSNCECIPLTFEFESTSSNPNDNSTPGDLDFFINPLITTSWSYNYERSRFIYQVIHTKNYYLKVGNKLGVSDAEIYTTFTKLCYSLQEIDAFTHKKEFDTYLFDCYEQVLSEEEDERLTYLNAPLLQKMMLHNTTPDRVWSSVLEVTSGIKSLDRELQDLFTDLKFRRISGSNFDQQREPLDLLIEQKREYQQYLLQKYKHMADSGKYRRRHFLKMAFRTAKRSLEGTFYEPVNCGTLSLCNFYISEYCRWYNKTFSDEITTTQQQKRSDKRMQKRLATKKSDPRIELLRPYLTSGLSYQKIATETGIPKTTVVNLLKKIA